MMWFATDALQKRIATEDTLPDEAQMQRICLNSSMALAVSARPSPTSNNMGGSIM